MPQDDFLAYLAFAFVIAITPGPNNVLAMVSAVNFGFLRTIPLILGCNLGTATMIMLIGFGLASFITAYPVAEAVLKLASGIYILWLAVSLAVSEKPGGSRLALRPLYFGEAAALQVINPKAWVMAVGAVATFLPEITVQGLLVMALGFVALNLPCVALWARAGVGLRRLLTNPVRLGVFNCVMAGLLVASLWSVMKV